MTTPQKAQPPVPTSVRYNPTTNNLEQLHDGRILRAIPWKNSEPPTEAELEQMLPIPATSQDPSAAQPMPRTNLPHRASRKEQYLQATQQAFAQAQAGNFEPFTIPGLSPQECNQWPKGFAAWKSGLKFTNQALYHQTLSHSIYRTIDDAGKACVVIAPHAQGV